MGLHSKRNFKNLNLLLFFTSFSILFCSKLAVAQVVSDSAASAVYARAIRCPKTSPQQIQCDSSEFNSLGARTRSIRLNDADSVDFSKIFSNFRVPEIVGNNEVINYKFVSDQLAAFFMCIQRNQSGRANMNCFLYYNSTRKENFVQMAENEFFVTIRFSKPEVVQTIKRIFSENGAAAYVSSEQVALRSGSTTVNKPRVTLNCLNNYCDLVAIPQPVVGRPVGIVDDRPFN
ncbi:MAG: hypothetical protein ACOYOK_09535 [Pseudobdellovibrionaceae bacterium]